MIKRIVIVGGGTAGWMSATFLNKLFSDQLDITLVESESIGTVGVGEATIPPIQLFNKLIHLDEQTFVQRTRATFKLGIAFNNWKRNNHSYMHAFGNVGRQIGLTPFLHYWLHQQKRNSSHDLWDFSLNYQLCKHNKILNSPDVPYAYHFDATLYSQVVRELAEQRGVKRVEGKVQHVIQQPDSGFIESVQLESGEQISGDFFIDCSGFRALLIGKALQVRYDDWSYWLKCDSAIAVASDRVEVLQPYTQSTAMHAGWQWQIPLQHRTGNGLVYASDYISTDEAQAHLLANLNSAPRGELKYIRFTPGRRTRQWDKNCLAIGLASGFLEPLESTSLHMIQTSLVKFAKLFPASGDFGSSIDEYNRQSQQDAELIRDFIILHYALNERTNDPFWQDCMKMQLPDSLAARMALFKQSGMIFREQNELFTEDSWLQVMIGQGLTPEHIHPLTQTMEAAKIDDMLTHLHSITQNQLRGANDYRQFMQQIS